jgi:hypothetical protein
MDDIIRNIMTDEKWRVLFQDSGFWRVGIYRPEHISPADITMLERHTCPELFICVDGEAGLLIIEDGAEKTLEMNHGEAFLAEGLHNGYSIDGKGFFIIVERTKFTTEYIERATGMVVKRVETG